MSSDPSGQHDGKPASTALKGPLFAAWEVTRRCNLRCRHCLNNCGNELSNELSVAEGRRLVRELIDLPVHSLCLCGGEPLLRNDIDDIIHMVAEAGITVNMVSNGLLLNKARAAELKSAGLGFLQISLDGATAATHELLRGGHRSYDKAVAAIHTAVQAGLNTAVAFAPNCNNIHELDSFVDLVYDLGSRHIRMMPLLGLGRATERGSNLQPTDDQMADLRFTIWRKRAQYVDDFFQIEWGDPVDHIVRGLHQGLDVITICILADGTFGISPYLPLTFGNLREGTLKDHWTAGLRHAWSHPATRQYAERIDSIIALSEQMVLPYFGEDVAVTVMKER
ncbi:radical SAM protein [Candidatus Zixiibacteriota bacterium]